MPNGAKVKMTFSIGCDVSKQTLTLTVLLSCISYENLHYYPQNLFSERDGSWMVGCFGLNGPLRQYFSLYRTVSLREGEKREIIDERKMSKQPHPHLLQAQ